MHINAEHIVAIGFFLFLLVLIYYGVHRMAIDSLDNRIQNVKDQLAEAEALRAEALHLLASLEAKRKTADDEAAAVIAQAKEEAQLLAKEAQRRTAEFIARRSQQAEAKIALAEAQAQQDVRAAAADSAVRGAEIILRDQANDGLGSAMLDKSIQNILAQLHA